MIFQHTIDKVLSGEKTQTRRLITQGQQFFEAEGGIADCVFVDFGDDRFRTIYEVGKTYAVQPGRGKAAVARIRVLSIRREDVRDISLDDAKAEGWELNPLDPVTEYPALWYLRLWTSMHDEIARVKLGLKPMDTWRDYLKSLPAERYDAWVLTFELAKGE